MNAPQMGLKHGVLIVLARPKKQSLHWGLSYFSNAGGQVISVLAIGGPKYWTMRVSSGDTLHTGRRANALSRYGRMRKCEEMLEVAMKAKRAYG
jgi:hypothetical protein